MKLELELEIIEYLQEYLEDNQGIKIRKEGISDITEKVISNVICRKLKEEGILYSAQEIRGSKVLIAYDIPDRRQADVLNELGFTRYKQVIPRYDLDFARVEGDIFSILENVFLESGLSFDECPFEEHYYFYKEKDE